MRRLRSVPLVCLVTLIGGCVATNAVRLGSATARPPLAPDSVVVYRTASAVPGKYEEIALINAAGDYEVTNEEKMLKAMQKKAGELGANAIIVDAMSEPTTGAMVAHAFFRGFSANRKGKAVAIYVFKEPNATARGDTSRRAKPDTTL